MRLAGALSSVLSRDMPEGIFQTGLKQEGWRKPARRVRAQSNASSTAGHAR
jgi:hypothetical protein